MIPADDKVWARAFALQALSDLRARDVLEREGIDKCHKLHFLQMAAEKTCKAYLIGTSGYGAVKFSHAYVAKYIPIIARQWYGVAADRVPSRRQLSRIKQLAHEIELLSPACDENGQRRDNSEYPWMDDKGRVQTPCSFGFPNIDDSARSIVPLVRLIRLAAQKYSG